MSFFSVKDNFAKMRDYPVAIAQATQAVNELDYRIAEVRHQIARLEGRADLVVAFEINLKNDTQRKARRFEILDDNPDHQKLQDELIRLLTDKSNALAHLEHLRNQFSVSKLEARMAIAEKLDSVESRELVGL